MKLTPIKDILFVSIQLLLFLLYFLSPFQTSIQINHFIKYTALLFAVIGLLVILIAIYQLNRNLTPFPTPKKNGTLVQSGPYKFVRHPVYSGIILAATGYGLFDGSIWKICIGLGLIILFYFKSKYEENMLCRHFPEYESYKKKTGRFFPFI